MKTVTIFLLSSLFIMACGDDSDSGGDSSQYADARVECVDNINAYRATEGLPPLERWVDAEACSDGEAKEDYETSTPHGAFGDCGESAQNECPGWNSVESVLDGCLQMMWDEGPGDDFSAHGHYLNMSSTSYTKVACGFYTSPEGQVQAVQNFSR